MGRDVPAGELSYVQYVHCGLLVMTGEIRNETIV